MMPFMSFIELYHINYITLIISHYHFEGDTKCRHFTDDIFKCIFFMKIFQFRLKFHWRMFPMDQLTTCQHWFRQWLGTKQVTSHYLNLWWPRLQMHIWFIYSSVNWIIKTSDDLLHVWCQANTWTNATISLHWRHNDHDSVSNHQSHGCLLNRLFGSRSKKASKLCVTGLCAGNSPGPVNSPHKGPVTRKMSPFDDVIMF